MRVFRLRPCIWQPECNGVATLLKAGELGNFRVMAYACQTSRVHVQPVVISYTCTGMSDLRTWESTDFI